MAEKSVETPPESKPKAERKAIEYVVLGAVGEKNAKIDQLEWFVLGRVSALTPGAAKEQLLASNPAFPGPTVADVTEGKEQVPAPKDLQSLVRGKRLWLEAKSGWSPKLVEVEQPPPKFVGL